VSVALADVAGHLTAFVTSQNSVVGTTEERATAGIGAIASGSFRSPKFCRLFVVGFDLWAVEELMNSCDVD
jgi:hypothetical protein